MIEIPLNSNPEQLFSIVLAETTYDMRVILNSRLGIWSIGLSTNGNSILDGIALVGGVDIFKQYNINITNAYVVNIDNVKEDASKDNLGTVAKLFVLTNEEITSG